MNRSILRNLSCGILACLVTGLSQQSHASDAALLAALKAKGAEVTEVKGEITGISYKSNKDLTEADYQKVRQIPHLKSFGCAAGFDDTALKALAGLPELEMFSSNGFSVSDEGMKTLATFKNLRSIAFFHPGKGFTGTGLEALASLPNLERLTVAGSVEFGDEGIAAVGKLAHLKEFRTWHSGVTSAGVKKLQGLKELKSLNIGQRLAYQPPTTVNDDTVAALAEIPSLEALTVQEARLSLSALSRLKQLPHLKKLTLDSIEISEVDLASLKQQLPHTDVKSTPPTEAAQKRIKSLFPAKQS